MEIFSTGTTADPAITSLNMTLNAESTGTPIVTTEDITSTNTTLTAPFKRNSIKVVLPSGVIHDINDIHKPDFERLAQDVRALRSKFLVHSVQADSKIHNWEKKLNELDQMLNGLQDRVSQLVFAKRESETIVIGDTVQTKSTNKGPYVIIGETAKAMGDQRTVIECWLARDTKGRDLLLPRADVRHYVETTQSANFWHTIIGSSAVSAAATMLWLLLSTR